MTRIFTLLLLLHAGCAIGQLPFRLPSILGDHAVLQRTKTIHLWGWGPGGDTVKITGSWNTSDTFRTPIAADCAWSADLPAPSEQPGPYRIEFVCGRTHRTISDILVGEVWLCSGQSNMEFNARWGLKDKIDTGSIADREMRFFQVGQNYQAFPSEDCQGTWRVCNASSMADFSSVGYFFGRRLREAIHRPVGLIGSYWGGTNIQAWIPKAFFDSNARYDALNKNIGAYGWAPEAPGLLYNAMIYPLTPFHMAGVIWYQGEANVGNGPSVYGGLFRGLIDCWRKAFGRELPIYFVQIAPWNGYPGIDAAILREQQQSALNLPATGMAPSGDLVTDVANIHPPEKEKLGQRLANLALKEQYGIDSLHPYSPHIIDYSIHERNIVLKLSAEGKMVVPRTGIKGFEIAGHDGVFYPAMAKYGKDESLTLSAAQVLAPTAARYCFSNIATPTFLNRYGLPLLPFRTDRPKDILTFHNHKFRILQFTDLHWITGGGQWRKGDDSAMALMRTLMLKEKPDLVVFTGDNVVSGGAAAAWKEVTQPFIDLQIPFVVAFGNHDAETDLTKRQALDIIQANPYNLTFNADDRLSGMGNCNIAIRDEAGRDKAVLYFFDSHNLNSDSTVKSYYDWIKNDQVQWYRRVSTQYERTAGHPLPSLSFFHIPLPEFAQIYKQPETVGNALEEVAAPRMNSGLFSAFAERKDMKGVFVGHDHNDDFIGVLDNICLAYGRKTGYNAPYPEMLERGARVIDFHEDGTIDTYITALSGRSLEFSKPAVTSPADISCTAPAAAPIGPTATSRTSSPAITAVATPSTTPIATGTFIQESLIRNWDDHRWQQELKALKEVGMRYLVLAPTLHSDSDRMPESYYPTTLAGVRFKEPSDLVDNCLRNAAKAGFKVFLGLNFDERWWSANATPEWLNKQMETGNQVADELIHRYKAHYGDVLYGWYWVWEVDNLHIKSVEAQQALATALNINLDHLHAVTPSMPVMLCPFMNYRVGTVEECRQAWTNIFSHTRFAAGDIFAPQDGVGAGGLDLDRLGEWYKELKKAVDSKPGLLFWSDAETFDQRFWTIAPLDRFVRQMQVVRPYVSNIISFAYSHYYSPLKENPAFHEAYKIYTRTGRLPHLPVPGMPVKLAVSTDEKNAVVLGWREPSHTQGLAGYRIFRNGVLIGVRQYHLDSKCSTTFTDKTPGPGNPFYELCAYTSTGVEGKRAGSQPTLPGLDSYTIPLGIRGAVIASASHLRIVQDTSSLFTVDKAGRLRLKSNVALDTGNRSAGSSAWRYGLSLSIDGKTTEVTLVKDQFISNKVIAHRGAWKHHNVSENSLGSLRNAIALGCEGSEFDVWMSSDSMLVISHDPVIGGKTIESTKGGELLQLPLQSGETVPSLDDYLEQITMQNRTRLYLEIKSSGISQQRSLALADKVVETVRRHKAQAWVRYISFNYEVLQRIRQLDPAAVTAYLTGDRSTQLLSEGGIGGVDYPWYSYHPADMIEEAHRLGLSVNAWTVDSKEEMSYLLGKGIDMITTNEPEMLFNLMRKK